MPPRRRRLRNSSAEAKREEAEKHERNQKDMDFSVKWFEALPESEKKTMESEFLAESNPIDRGLFKQKGYGCIVFRFFVKKKWLNVSQLYTGVVVPRVLARQSWMPSDARKGHAGLLTCPRQGLLAEPVPVCFTISRMPGFHVDDLWGMGATLRNGSLSSCYWPRASSARTSLVEIFWQPFKISKK